ncbi:MAG: DNA-binding protein WhiA [Candidatus Desulforudis sp.]|nr:DNA-binding protein WhiA [Desulforudis sp.]
MSSFSVQTKDELARIQGWPCCQAAELAALLAFNGRLVSGDGLLITTENAAIARKVFKGLKTVFGLSAQVEIRRKTRLKKNNEYLVRVEAQDGLRPALMRLGLVNASGRPRSGLKRDLVRRQCCRRAYLRGAFLARGSVSSPRGAYHLEITVTARQSAADLSELMQKLGLDGRFSARKRAWVVYIKDGEQLAAALVLMGAHSALLRFENARIYKGMRNQVNRLVNCDTANLSKTVLAGVRQEESIRMVVESIGLDGLSPPLRQVARLRLQNPEISLRELGEMAQPPLSKSCVNHRLRKLESIAHNILTAQSRKGVGH